MTVIAVDIMLYVIWI